MRQLKATYQTKTLNFRHWSRKGYAAFVSLDKVVRIAVLKMAVSDRLSVKISLAGCISLFEEMFSSSDEEEEQERQKSTLSVLLEELLITVLKPAVAAAGVSDLKYNIGDISPVDICWRGFFMSKN